MGENLIKLKTITSKEYYNTEFYNTVAAKKKGYILEGGIVIQEPHQASIYYVKDERYYFFVGRNSQTKNLILLDITEDVNNEENRIK